MKKPTFGSLFAGIGGFDLALKRQGFRCAWQCEIDPNARRVLKHHWPRVPCYEDVRELKGKDLEPVTVVCGGFPCQGLSVAGHRAGLADARSGLFFEMLRLIGEIAPKWVFAENVPGLVSSWSPVEPAPRPVEGEEWEVEETSDLETVVAGLVGLGFGVAWRTLDSQFFGVPQRRNRIFIVGRAGDAGCAGEVLFEPESVQGNPPPSRQARADVAGGTAVGAGEGGSDAATLPP